MNEKAKNEIDKACWYEQRQTLGNSNMKLKPYPRYKDSGVQLIGKIPEEWEVHKLKYILTPIIGKNVSEGQKNYLEIGDIDVKTKKYKKTDKLTVSGAKNVPKSTILISTVRPNRGGITITEKRINVSSAFCKLKLDNKFSFFYLNSESFFIYLSTKSTGSTYPTCKDEDIFNYPFLQPYEKEQTAIANFLDKKTAKIDALIEKDKRLIELLKERRATLINHAVTKGLDPNVKMKDSGVEWIGKIPEGWKTSRLRFLGDSIIGLTYSPNDIIEEGSNSNLILRASNIQNNKLSLHDNIYVNKKIPKKLITKKGDILICSRNGSRELVGKNICIDERTKGCSFGAFMTVYRTKYWRFMSLFFNSQVFKSQSSLFLTTTINQLTISTLNNFYVAIPSNIEEQLAIVSFLNKFTARIDKTIQKIQKKIELLEEYKKSLIHHTVTGKIDVRGSEI